MSNKNSISYRKVGDYLIPNFVLPPEEVNITLGRWGMLHKDCLLNHKKVLTTTRLRKRACNTNKYPQKIKVYEKSVQPER